jgi:hypothetical protein
MQLDAKPALTKEGFGVVANENITSTGIVFDTVVSAFSISCKHSNAEG